MAVSDLNYRGVEVFTALKALSMSRVPSRKPS